FVAPGAQAEPLGVVNAVRAKGCGAPAAALKHIAALDAAAARVADGSKLRDAVTGSGYRSVNAALLFLDGARDDDELAKMVTRSCAQVALPGFRDAGVHQRGRTIWIVLAEPYTVPTLDAASTGAKVLDLVNRARAQARRCGNDEFGAAPPMRWSSTLEK